VTPRVSDRHANFFINAGHASAADMLALIAGVRERGARGLWSYSRNTRWSFGTSESPCSGTLPRQPAAADQEPYRPELVADEEPRYLRRQKPVEIRRKKFSGKTWPFYRRVFLWTVIGAVTVARRGFTRCAMRCTRRKCSWVKPDQIEVAGNHIVPREEVLKLFVHDRNRSVLRIPLDDRRAQIQELAWVEEASVSAHPAESFAH